MHPEQVIDLLLPFHGRVDHFREAVLSVLAQTSPEWRLVVVDDASPGDIAPWLEGLADPRIDYHRNPANLGFAANFQRCLDLATAEHVVFLGGDDRLLPDYVAEVGAVARDTRATMVQPGVAVIDAAGQPHQPLTDRVKHRLRQRLPPGVPLRGERVATSLMHGAWTYFPSICWRRESLVRHGFDPTYGLALDVALIMTLLREGGSLLVLDDVLFEYRRHDESASVRAARAADRFEQERAFFARMAQALEDVGWPRAARAARLHATSRLHATAVLPRALLTGDRAAARGLLRHLVHR